MASDKNLVIGFDLYGTLLSTESIAKKLADHFGQEKAQQLAATWRKYQLEYTWRSNSMSMLLFPVAALPVPFCSIFLLPQSPETISRW